jgi:hypothetical protein
MGVAGSSLKSFYGTEPRADAAALGWWSLPAYAIGLLLFASYAVLMHRGGGGRAVEGIVTGTAFFSSTILLAKAVVIHQLALRDYFMFVGYHVATAYYVESRLAFRDVKLHVALYVCLRCGPDGASLARRAYSRRGAYLQIRGKHQEIHQVLPLSRHSEVGPAGAGERRHLHGLPGGSLSEAPQVGKG